MSSPEIKFDYPIAAINGNSIHTMHQLQQQPPHHINQLLTTAAAGAGVVGDVDALLMPMQRPTSRFPPERNLWRTDEVVQMLNIMQEIGAIELLNDKTVKSDRVFRNIEHIMNEKGYCKKSHGQIWTKWKFLKSTYTTSKRKGTVPMIPRQVYDILQKMLGDNPSEKKPRSTRVWLTDDANVDNMAICGGDCNITPSVDEIPAEPTFEMAHPIFGLRLGTVKNEPSDTGYDTAVNNGSASENNPLDESNANSSCSSTAQAVFQADVKQEVDESPLIILPSEQPLPVAPSESRTLIRITSLDAPKPHDLTPLPRANLPQVVASNPNMPTLRLAPFAKDPMQPETRPPPPLTMQKSSRLPRMMYDNSASKLSSKEANFSPQKMEPKTKISAQSILLPPQLPQSPHPPIRLPKDIIVQPTPISVPIPSRIKQVPMRKAHYSSQFDREVCDIDATALMQPQLPAAQDFNYEGPSTSQQALKVMNRNPESTIKKRKRRLEMSWDVMDTISPVLPKLSNTFTKRTTPQDFFVEDADDDDEADDEETSLNGFSFQGRTGQGARIKQQTRFKGKTSSRRDPEHFDMAFNDLTNALFQMQRDMMTTFFEHQMELTRREHEFQMKQDKLIMDAFKEESQLFLKASNILLGFDFDSMRKMKDETETNGVGVDIIGMFRETMDATNGVTTLNGNNATAVKNDAETEGDGDDENIADPIQLVTSELVEDDI